MCQRFDNLIGREAYRVVFKALHLPQSTFLPRYNIASPSQIAIVRNNPRHGTREVVMVQWGFIPVWGQERPKVHRISARANSVHELPMFRDAFAHRRCLIPATGFYQWQRSPEGRRLWRVVRRDLEPFAFAGIWETARLGNDEADTLSALIIVDQPTRLVEGVHERMPVIVAPSDYSRWLRLDASVEESMELLKPYDDDLLIAYPVSPAVDSVRNDNPNCIVPLQTA